MDERTLVKSENPVWVFWRLLRLKTSFLLLLLYIGVLKMHFGTALPSLESENLVLYRTLSMLQNLQYRPNFLLGGWLLHLEGNRCAFTSLSSAHDEPLGWNILQMMTMRWRASPPTHNIKKTNLDLPTPTLKPTGKLLKDSIYSKNYSIVHH